MTSQPARLFYSDPLDAAQMMKHFGMEIESLVGFPYRLSTLCIYGSHPARVNVPPRFYVSPESLHLLRLRGGDLLLPVNSSWWPFIFHEGYEVDAEGRVRMNRHGDYVACSIIRRNGLAFHWPESEAA